MSEYHEPDDADGEFELRMPFVTVASKGGPHDDASYAAGWEMAKIDSRLGAAVHHGLGLPEVVVRRDSLPQIDLIAMCHGVIATDAGGGSDNNLSDDTVDEWVRVTFAWGSQP